MGQQPLLQLASEEGDSVHSGALLKPATNHADLAGAGAARSESVRASLRWCPSGRQRTENITYRCRGLADTQSPALHHQRFIIPRSVSLSYRDLIERFIAAPSHLP
jgi:hypothetical protein